MVTVEREHVQYIKNKAATHYAYQLWNSKRGLKAVDYLLSRGIEKETIIDAGLGYAHGSRSLYRYFKKCDISINRALNSSLILKSLYEEGAYEDFFNGYIVIPVFHKGNAVTFTARLVGNISKSDKRAKFLHLKGATRHLYNLDAIHKSKHIIIVESVFNALSLKQWGYTAIACLGSSIPRGLEEVFKDKYVYLAFDQDTNNSGQKGAYRTAKLLYNIGVDPYILTLPESIDVNDYANMYTRDDFSCKIMHKKRKFSATEHFAEWQEQEKEKAKRRKYNAESLYSIEKLKMIPITMILDSFGIKTEYQGRLLKARCPLPDHLDENGSFIVYSEDNQVKCFGCGFFGDTIGLVSKYLNVNFREAVKYLQKHYGE